MIFIAESGSTKCDAVFVEKGGTEEARFEMQGLNPQHMKSGDIKTVLNNIDDIKKYGQQTTEVYFYGAGCSSPKAIEIVDTAISYFFPNAKTFIAEDLLAVAHATSHDKASICCILGTGSNCFYYDGSKPQLGISGLGYILGDEGSAGDIGKRTVLAYLHKKLPEELEQKFRAKYNLDRNDIIQKVYREPHANVFLAGFSRFAGDNRDHPFFANLINESLAKFIDEHVLYFKEAELLPIHFVGSVAFHFKDLLKDAFEKRGLILGKVIQKPINALINYHTDKK